MSLICEFCDKKFSTKGTLNTHQKKAKYCLEKRGIKPNNIKCEFCHKSFLEKRQFEKHKRTCYVDNYNIETEIDLKYKKQISVIKTETKEKILEAEKVNKLRMEDLKKQISSLEKLVAIGLQKKTIGITANLTKNNIIIQPLTQKWIDKSATLLQKKDLSNGVEGLAIFACKNTFNNRVVCSDTARKTFRYENEDGEKVIDKKGKKMINKFSKSIIDISKSIIEEVKEDIDIDDFYVDNMNNISCIENGIKAVCKGETHHKFIPEFAHKISEILPASGTIESIEYDDEKYKEIEDCKEEIEEE